MLRLGFLSDGWFPASIEVCLYSALSLNHGMFLSSADNCHTRCHYAFHHKTKAFRLRARECRSKRVVKAVTVSMCAGAAMPTFFKFKGIKVAICPYPHALLGLGQWKHIIAKTSMNLPHATVLWYNPTQAAHAPEDMRYAGIYIWYTRLIKKLGRQCDLIINEMNVSKYLVEVVQLEGKECPSHNRDEDSKKGRALPSWIASKGIPFTAHCK